MLQTLIISIGLVLVIEGLIYLIIADRLSQIISILENFNSKKIKIFSLSMIFIGFCLIYFTFRFYREIY